jgi:DNA helicase-2/ATP-dependent DNA helicase PcrA
LTELTLDPPNASGAEAARPQRDEDYLILLTIHSAKGQEWDGVFVLNLVDGCIPSDMASAKPEQIDEERRLLYVAMTRAREHLHLLQPLRFYLTHQHRHGHVMGPRSRFLRGSAGRHRRPAARYVELTRPGAVIASACDGPRTSRSR